MRKKIIVVLGIILAALLFLIVRLFYINLVKGDDYEKTVLDQQEYSSKTIPYKRGDIVDRNHTVLATSTDVYNVVLDCKVLNSKEFRTFSLFFVPKCSCFSLCILRGTFCFFPRNSFDTHLTLN